jgi:hypothetical protein
MEATIYSGDLLKSLKENELLPAFDTISIHILTLKNQFTLIERDIEDENAKLKQIQETIEEVLISVDEHSDNTDDSIKTMHTLIGKLRTNQHNYLTHNDMSCYLKTDEYEIFRKNVLMLLNNFERQITKINAKLGQINIEKFSEQVVKINNKQYNDTKMLKKYIELFFGIFFFINLFGFSLILSLK